jgi:hypothetical protein
MQKLFLFIIISVQTITKEVSQTEHKSRQTLILFNCNAVKLPTMTDTGFEIGGNQRSRMESPLENKEKAYEKNLWAFLQPLRKKTRCLRIKKEKMLPQKKLHFQ